MSLMSMIVKVLEQNFMKKKHKNKNQWQKYPVNGYTELQEKTQLPIN